MLSTPKPRAHPAKLNVTDNPPDAKRHHTFELSANAPSMPSAEDSAALGYGVENELHRMRDMVVELDLTNAQKRTIMSRVVQGLHSYKKKHKCVEILYHMLNTLNVIGLTAMPALLTLSSIDDTYARPIFWSSFTISIATGVSSAYLGFFQITRKYFLYRKLIEKIKREFYAYASLAEQFEKYDNHSAAFATFIHVVESAIGKTVAKTLKQANTAKPIGSTRSVASPSHV